MDENIKRKYCNELLSGKTFCGYDRLQKEAYEEISSDKNFQDIKNRLENVGCILNVSYEEKSLYTKIDADLDIPTKKLNLFESRVVLMLVQKYFTGFIKSSTIGTVIYKWTDLLNDLSNLIQNTNDRNKLIDVIFHLKKLNVLTTNTSKENFKDAIDDENEDDIIIKIYPTIKYVFNLADLEEVNEKIKFYCNGGRYNEE